MTEFCDVHSASDEYAARFSGVAGAWLLSVQTSGLLSLLNVEVKGRTFLDVGGGHGQVAIPLAERGAEVTVVASEEAGLFRVKEAIVQGKIKSATGNLLALPFESNSFDYVLSFRLLPHCDEWPHLIKELCRVARKGVIVDYPVSHSVNALAPALFGAKKNVEKNTRPFTLFTDAQIDAQFKESGFISEKKFKQFFLPMVIHRMLKSPRLSALGEAPARMLGLTAVWGSPVIGKYRPLK